MTANVHRVRGVWQRCKEWLRTRLWKDRDRDSGERKPAMQKVMIAGLGNPGRQYQDNRHNIGFMTVDRIAERFDVAISRKQMRASVGSGQIDGLQIILVKPQTFMNKSGDAIGPLANYYRIEPSRLLVVYDEMDLPLGTLRLRKEGGAGGHNGMKSIINHVGQGFPRLRLGVGRPSGRLPAHAYLLQDFGDDEQPVVDKMIEKAVSAVKTFLLDGIEIAMNSHNGSVVADEK